MDGWLDGVESLAKTPAVVFTFGSSDTKRTLTEYRLLEMKHPVQFEDVSQMIWGYMGYIISIMSMGRKVFTLCC